MRCSQARTALSARIDGEAEGTFATAVDDHLDRCPACCSWYILADQQTRGLRELAAEPTPNLSGAILNQVTPDLAADATRRSRLRVRITEIGLAACGIAQLAVATAQLGGMHFGMIGHGDPMSAHVMNETTAWAFALGAGMLGAAFWRAARPGLLVILAVFAVLLGGYVVNDALSAGVTFERILSHAPVFLGLLFAAFSVRKRGTRGPDHGRLAGPRSLSGPVPTHRDEAA